VQAKCNTPLESSQGKLQLWFRPRPDLSLGQEVMRVQSPESPNRENSGLHFGSPGKKSHLDASAAESCKEYYMGEGGGFPRVWAMVSKVSPR